MREREKEKGKKKKKEKEIESNKIIQLDVIGFLY